MSGPYVIDVRNYGAVGDGTTDDTAAISSAISYANGLYSKTLYFPAGRYLISSPLTAIIGNNWDIMGDGDASIIRASHNGVVFTFDLTTFGCNFGAFHDLRIESTIAVNNPFMDTQGIYVKAGTTVTRGLNYWNFYNVAFIGIANCIVFDPTTVSGSGGLAGIAQHGFNNFNDLTVSYADNPAQRTIWYKGGPGPHSSIHGGQFRGEVSCVQFGMPGNTVDGIGDFLMVGTHFLKGGHAVDAYCSTGLYNQNVTVSGCQFDNMTNATVYVENAQNWRIFPNNSTSTAGPVLVNCSNMLVEDRNAVTLPRTLTVGGLTTANGGLTTAGNVLLGGTTVIADPNGPRHTAQVIARRNVNTDAAKFLGGDGSSAGANFVLFGGAHATDADRTYLSTVRFRVRSQDATTVFADFDASRATLYGGVRAAALPQYADNTAAGAAGLAVGDFYRTATGELRVRY